MSCTAISRTINDIRCLREDREMADTVRDSRLDLRVTKSEKEAIERAAALSGSSTTDFVRSTMLVAAERAVRAHRVLELTSEGAAAFVDAITNPPEPNDNLRALAREAQEIPGQAKERVGAGFLLSLRLLAVVRNRRRETTIPPHGHSRKVVRKPLTLPRKTRIEWAP
jgi:uncharacterized protein (DUF1778 family)